VLRLGYQRIKSRREKQARLDGILAARDSDGLAESEQLRTLVILAALLRT
jgi:hypothetical protein